MQAFRVHINRRREGRYQGFTDSVLTDRLPSVIRSLDALPGDSLAVEDANDDWERAFYLVVNGPDGLKLTPN